jgi:cyclic pyranopterin phosphate synthase
MPRQTFEHIACEELLRYEEILFFTEVCASLGVDKVRVTGGEPLVRKDLPYFLAKLYAIEGINEVTLTTNASLLPLYAKEIFNSGVKRLNISLDSLKSDRFRFVSGGIDNTNTMRGIEEAIQLGFAPIKVNAVAIRGFNDDEILDFCEFAAEKNVIVRFIEFMPIGNSADWKKDNIIYGAEILKIITDRYEAEPLPHKAGAGPAKNYKLSNGATIGIITPMSEHFCNSCDKIRLTSDGKIRPCLLSDSEIDITDAASRRDTNALKELLIRSLSLKEAEHSIKSDSKEKFSRTMSKIGG